MSSGGASEAASLLPGRNTAPLDSKDIRRAINTFLGFEEKISIIYEPDSFTRFRICTDDNGDDYGEIVLGPDIYAGGDITDSNSMLSITAAAAHEFSHYHRWLDKSELPHGKLMHLDEALTSLDAISRYSRLLDETDMRQLAADAIKRIRLFIAAKERIGAP